MLVPRTRAVLHPARRRRRRPPPPPSCLGVTVVVHEEADALAAVRQLSGDAVQPRFYELHTRSERQSR